MNDEQKTLTPEQQAQLQIETERRARAMHEENRERIRQEREREQETRRQEAAAETFKGALQRTGIRFHEPDAVRTLLTDERVGGFTLTPSNDGTFFKCISSEGKEISVERAIEQLVIQRPHLSAGGHEHLLPKRDEETGQFAELCRDDFGNNFAAKSRWIAEHPGQWEKLTQHRVPKVEIAHLNASRYRALPYSKKLEVLKAVGEAGIAAIMSRR